MDVFSFNRLDVRPGAEERADSTPTDATPSSEFSRIEAREIRNEDVEIVRDDTCNFAYILSDALARQSEQPSLTISVSFF